MRIRLFPFTAALAVAAVTPGSASATDGHFLHGVGAINSALGGAGVASANSILGAFFVNPAALALFSGTQSELSMEMFKPERTVSSSFGTFRGSTTSRSEFVPVPAFGWSTTFRDDRLAIGLGGLGIGGFGVRYPADPSNPVLMPRPNGFGQVYSNFSLLKVTPTLAWRATPRLLIGAAINVGWASLAVDPMPTASPAADPGPDQQPFTQDDRAFYSGATHTDGAFGLGATVGMVFRASDRFSLGASYASPQVFEDFAFDAVYENPNLPSYNTPRTFTFSMDVPAIYAAGVSISPTERFNVAADLKYMAYASTNGFKESGFNQDGSVRGFGWNDITVLAVGAQLKASDALTLRGGYNYSGNPIPDEQSFFNVPAPAIVQHHLTAGFGVKVAEGLQINVAYYTALENSITGAMFRPNGALPGTSVTNSLSEQSLVLGFAIAPKGRK